MAAKGIKLRVSDGNGGLNHIVWVPKPWTIIGWAASFAVSFAIVVASAGGLRDRWNQIPANTRWISQHKKENIETKAKLDAVCKLSKTILMKIDPANAPTIIEQIEEQERSLAESMARLEIQKENDGDARLGK